MAADVTPATAPTDRSISPSSSTRTTPTEIVPMAAICSVRLTRFCAVRNESFAMAKITQMTASVIRTRAEPSSPSASLRRAAPGDRLPASSRSATLVGGTAVLTSHHLLVGEGDVAGPDVPLGAGDRGHDRLAV